MMKTSRSYTPALYAASTASMYHLPQIDSMEQRKESTANDCAHRWSSSLAASARRWRFAGGPWPDAAGPESE